ncbi:MAG TPA: TIGR04222 domain-containing membrane protein [Pseudonocardiaceae bacterium]|jgi:uncharacterized protein (TIGR04222 family)
MGWSQYALAEGAALVLSAVIRFPMRGKRRDMDISPTVLGYLIGGTKRAVTTALAMLYVRGAIRVSRPGMVRHTDGKFGSVDRLLSATYSAIYQPNGPGAIALKPPVHRAVAEVRKGLIDAGLWVPTRRWVIARILILLDLPLIYAQLTVSHSAASISLATTVFVLGGALYSLDRQTGLCRVRTSRLRRSRPVASDADSVGYAVAARGKRALLAIMPKFAKAAGLFDGGVTATYLSDDTIGPNLYIWGG